MRSRYCLYIYVHRIVYFHLNILSSRYVYKKKKKKKNYKIHKYLLKELKSIVIVYLLHFSKDKKYNMLIKIVILNWFLEESDIGKS